VACDVQYDDDVFQYFDGCGSEESNGSSSSSSSGGGSRSSSGGGDAGFIAKSRSIFDPARSQSVVSQICGTYADCQNQSIAVHGFSQGAHIAQLSSTFHPNIGAALLYGNGHRATLVFTNIDLPCMMMDDSNEMQLLDRTRRRYITGQNDIVFSP
jgi:hypothetical protein